MHQDDCSKYVMGATEHERRRLLLQGTISKTSRAFRRYARSRSWLRDRRRNTNCRSHCWAARFGNRLGLGQRCFEYGTRESS
jgi:hypothetical protein